MCPVGSSGQTFRPGRPAHFTAAEAESPTGEWRFQVALQWICSGKDGHDRKQGPHLLGFLNNMNLVNPDRSPNKEKFIQVVTSLNLKSVQQLECPLPDCAIYGAPCPLHSHLSVANPVFFPAAPCSLPSRRRGSPCPQHLGGPTAGFPGFLGGWGPRLLLARNCVTSRAKT